MKKVIMIIAVAAILVGCKGDHIEAILKNLIKRIDEGKDF